MRADTQLTASYLPADTTEALIDSTAGDLLRHYAKAAPDRAALVDGIADAAGRRQWSYAELGSLVERTARGLLKQFRPGERVAICSPNSAEWVILQLSLNVAGLVLVPINPAYRLAELEVILASSEAAGLFYIPHFRDNPLEETVSELKKRLPGLRLTHRLADVSALADDDAELPTVKPTDLMQIQFTSGTSGVPKGACLHHYGSLNTSRFVALRAQFPEGGVWLNAMPLFHVGGSVVCLMGTLALGGTFVIAGGFDAAICLELIEREKVNCSLFVPTMILALLEHPDFPRRDLSSMVTVLTGASPVSAALVERTKAAFGSQLIILFGQTEINGVLTVTTPNDSIDDQTQTVGRPLPQSEVRIADADGSVVPCGAPGEIQVRGYQTMLGYSRQEHLTEATLEKDGWLHTGDIGSMDSRGYLKISGRLKDMIIRGGMNLYPREIEDLLAKHEGVGDVSVVGVPDEKWGEVIAAVIRPKAKNLTADDLHAFCRERISPHKTPVKWFFVESFPLTPSGKIQKFVLQEWIATGKIT